MIKRPWNGQRKSLIVLCLITGGKRVLNSLTYVLIEPPHDKTNKMICAPSEDSDQPGHLPSLIRVFAMRLMGS